MRSSTKSLRLEIQGGPRSLLQSPGSSLFKTPVSDRTRLGSAVTFLHATNDKDIEKAGPRQLLEDHLMRSAYETEIPSGSPGKKRKELRPTVVLARSTELG